jgi:hypothetical protein
MPRSCRPRAARLNAAERRRLLVRATMRAAGARSLAGVTADDVARALVDETIRRGIEQRESPPDIDIELAAWTFVGYFSTIASAKQFGRPPEWIYHLQIALLRNLFGSEAVDRVLTGARARPLTSDRLRTRGRRS